MMNIHAPERLAGESQQDYRARRQISRAIVADRLAPANSNRFIQRENSFGKHRAVGDQGQRPKFDAPRKRKPKAAIKPTWPCTDDQKQQGRPLIVLGPNRERDASKREKPKSAVAKRMDRPSRSTLMEAGHGKLMRFFAV